MKCSCGCIYSNLGSFAHDEGMSHNLSMLAFAYFGKLLAGDRWICAKGTQSLIGLAKTLHQQQKI